MTMENDKSTIARIKELEEEVSRLRNENSRLQQMLKEHCIQYSAAERKEDMILIRAKEFIPIA